MSEGPRHTVNITEISSIFSACRLKKHAYAGLPPSENHASQGKNVHTNTRNSAFPRALFMNISKKLRYPSVTGKGMRHAP